MPERGDPVKEEVYLIFSIELTVMPQLHKLTSRLKCYCFRASTVWNFSFQTTMVPQNAFKCSNDPSIWSTAVAAAADDSVWWMMKLENEQNFKMVMMTMIVIMVVVMMVVYDDNEDNDEGDDGSDDSIWQMICGRE